MKITVGLAETINTGDGSFESLRPGIMVEDDVSSGETPHEAYNRIHTIARTLYVLHLSRMITDRDMRISQEPERGSTGLHTWVGKELAKLHNDPAVEKLLTTAPKE